MTAFDQETIGGPDKVAGAALIEAPNERDPRSSQQSATRQPDGATDAPSQSVYRRAARRLIPCWMDILGPALPVTRFHRRSQRDANHRDRAALSARRQSAALSSALVCELNGPKNNVRYMREAVRAGLVRWELSLRADGCPAQRADRSNPLHAAALLDTVLLLGETADFQTSLLLGDVQRHLDWLARRRFRSPWLEACLICAMLDGSVLLRSGGLRAPARERLARLLASQDVEGWFPECGVADVQRLSLTVDALARVYDHHGWEELVEPLGRALRFLGPFAGAPRSESPDRPAHDEGATQPNAAGSCHRWAGCEISPYGPELLADRFPEAALLAQACRVRWEAALAGNVASSGHGPLGVPGVGVALASTCAPRRLPAIAHDDDPEPHSVHYPRSGYSIVTTSSYHAVFCGLRGGPLTVHWHGTAGELSDVGLVVYFAHGVLTSIGARHSTREAVTDRSLRVSGTLQPARTRTPARWSQRLWSGRRRDSHPHRPGKDRFTREVSFNEETVTIRDQVWCHRPSYTVVVQIAALAPWAQQGGRRAVSLIDALGRRLDEAPHRAGWLVAPVAIDEEAAREGAGHTTPRWSTRGPICVEGGRYVQIVRTYRHGELVEPLVEPLTEPASACRDDAGRSSSASAGSKVAGR